MTQILFGNISYNSSTLVTTGLSILLVVLYRLVKWRSPRDKNYPPGPPALPVLGNLLDLGLSRLPQHELIYKWSKKYGKVFWFKIFHTGVVIINDMDIVHEALQNSDVCDRAPFIPSDKMVGRTNNGELISRDNGS